MIAQLGIAILGVTAVFLSQSTRLDRRRWASVFGLAGQPFWIWAAVDAGQWGILALCALYTWAWAKGFIDHWLRSTSSTTPQVPRSHPRRDRGRI